MKKTHYYTQKNLSTEYVYVEPQSDLGFDWDSNDDYEIIEEGNPTWDKSMISIEKLKKIVGEFEKQGANYVNVHYHCDHNEVEITGIVFGKSTKEEVDAYNERIAAQKEAQKTARIAALQAEIDRLKKS